jgi:hypothetical protein
MNMDEQIINTFIIVVKKRNTPDVFRMTADHIYSSAQVERFKVYGKNGRYVIMEKRLLNKQQPWKIVSGVPMGLKTNAEFEAAAMAIRDIQDKLDDYLLPSINDMEKWSGTMKNRGLN